MEKPIEPQLDSFGLTQAEYAAAPRPRFTGNRVEWYITVTVMILIGIKIYTASDSLIFAIVAGLFMMIPGMLIAVMLVSGVIKPIEAAKLARCSPTYRKAVSFDEALDAYKKKKKEYDDWLQKFNEDWWRSLSGVEFEVELGHVFTALGFEVKHTPSTADGGVDLILRKNGRLTVVQCKAHKKPIPIGVIRELAASMRDFKASDAILACFNGATKPVYEYIKDKPIQVVTVPDIVRMKSQLPPKSRE